MKKLVETKYKNISPIYNESDYSMVPDKGNNKVFHDKGYENIIISNFIPDLNDEEKDIFGQDSDKIMQQKSLYRSNQMVLDVNDNHAYVPNLNNKFNNYKYKYYL